MITDERLVNYIHSLEPDRSELLETIRAEALAAEIPIIRDETAALLKCFMRMLRPKRILEIGAAVGYSALCMEEACDGQAELLTVEGVGSFKADKYGEAFLAEIAAFAEEA